MPNPDAQRWHGEALDLAAEGRLEEACALLDKCVAVDPEGLMARNNLGVLLHRLGRREAAVGAYEALLALDPDNAAAHGNLACVLGELGHDESALAHAIHAVELDPSLHAPYACAAMSEARLGREAQALDWLDKGLALVPGHAAMRLAQAEILYGCGRYAEGLAAAQAVLALTPQDGRAWHVMGLLRHAVGEHEASVAALGEAAARSAQPARAEASRATVLLELGRQAEAMAGLDRALAAEPGLASAWYIRSGAKAFRPGDPDVAAMERALPGQVTEQGEMFLRFALGKAYLDLLDAPRAFAHLNRANGLRRADLDYDPGALAAEMAAIAEAFSPALFERFAGAGEPSARPVFIIGMPRSGTTLVEQILASHPMVRGGGEVTHIEQVSGELGAAYPAGLAGQSADRIAALGRRYLALSATPGGQVRHVTDKSVNNYLHVGLIRLILPGARLIHCRRDPVDTCLSCYSKPFDSGQLFSYDLADLGGHYRRYAALMDHWRAVLPAGRLIEVDYEAVVEDLEVQARRLVAFLGLDWDEACLRFHETRRVVRTSSLSQVRQPIYRDSLRRWPAFRDQLGPLLEALGDLTPQISG